MPKLTSVAVSLKLPFLGDNNGTWEPDETEQRAAWEMYVELVTRVSLLELQPGEGLLHEALASLYTLFESTRKVLREYGPAVARPKGEGQLSFGYLAIAIINCVIRPLLTKWHPKLLHYHSMRTDTSSSVLYAGQSHLIFGTGSTGCVTTSWLSKLCSANALYKPLENLDAIALRREAVFLTKEHLYLTVAASEPFKLYNRGISI